MAAILVIPVTLLLGLAGIVAYQSTAEALDAQRLVKLAKVSAAAGDLASRLSDERAAAVQLLAGGHDSYSSAVVGVDGAVGRWMSARESAGARFGDLGPVIDRAGTLLTGLESLRRDVQAGERMSLQVTMLRYRLLIASLLDVREGLVVAGVPTVIAERAQASVALSQAAEAAGLQQVAVIRAATADRLSPAAAAQIAAAHAAWTQNLQTWDASSAAPWRAWLDQALSGESMLAAQRIEGTVSRTSVGDRLQIDRDEWMTAEQARQERLRHVIAQADAGVVELLVDWGNQRIITASATAAVVLASLTLALWLAAFVARRTVTSLVVLREQATMRASSLLPAAVAALARRSDIDRLDGRVAAQDYELILAVHGADEVADVATAFNAIQTTAVDLALGQMRALMMSQAIIVDLGRRQQMLTDRLISKLDAAEGQEQDPERLARLFAIDQLANLMRRANANLLLLGGVPSAIHDQHPVALSDVLMASISQIERYTRVSPPWVEGDISVRPAAVALVVQAIAELLDNAVTFSQPERPVQVQARHESPNEVIVEVIDGGIGMTETLLLEENYLLAGKRQSEVPVMRRMGLQVVAEVARELNLRIQLRHNEYGGITAEVTLPDTVAFLQQVPAPTQLARQPALPPTPRPLERDVEALPGWPPAQTILDEVPAAGELPQRPRRRNEAPPPVAASVIALRDPDVLRSARSSFQRGIQAARAARRITMTSRGDQS